MVPTTKNTKDRAPLSGSARPRPDHHVFLERANPSAKISVSLIVRRQPGGPALPGLEHFDQTPLARRKYLTPAEYAERHGAAAEDLRNVEAFARAHGLTVVSSHSGRRTVSVEGTVSQMEAAFGITLNRYEAPMPGPASRVHGLGGDQGQVRGGSRESKSAKNQPFAEERKQVHHGFDGAVHLPHDLTDVVVAVIGLDDRLLGVPGGTGDPAGATSVSVPTAAGLYNFPTIGAADQTIGIIAPQSAAGVGASYLPGDITAYFASLPAGFQTAPTINNVNLTVGGTAFSNSTAAVTAVTAANLGSAANSSILEITQDICTSATIAQGATVNVYFTQNSEAGWVAFLSRVLQPEGENQPTIVSCSWTLFLGDDSGTVGKLSDSASSVSVLTTLFQELASVGVSCFIAIGDWGADNWWRLGGSPATPPDGKSHVMYPGTDPWITSCGGTIIATNAAPPPTINEQVWSDAYSGTFGNANSNFGATGGGVSQTFAAPAYQTAAGVTGATDSGGTFRAGRGVPDVAAMVAFSGFQVNGIGYFFTGTSCAAPFIAGLMAVIRSALGVALAPLNSLLYQLAGSAFNDVTTGNNDSGDSPANVKKAIPTYTGTTADAPFFTAGAGWDACSGLGSIDGIKLLDGIASLLYGRTWYFQVQKGTFGFDEVGITQTWDGKLSLVLEGFTPAQVTAAGLTPKVNVVLPGIDVTVGAAKPQIPSQTSTPQRIFFPCTIAFEASAIKRVADGGLFPPVGGADTEAPVSSVITFAGQIMTAETVFYLEPGADPYFNNYDPAGTNEFYLSDALRVFTVTPGFNNAPIDGIALNATNKTDFDTAAGYAYIQALLAHLNSTYADPTGTDPFTTLLPDQNAALSADSSVSPTTPNPAGGTFANYNFAIARVRLDGAVGESSVKNVKVFFRMFASETSDTDYQPALTYPSTSDAAGLPSEPLLGVGNVTIPFFATGNYEANGDFGKNTDYSANSINNQPVTISAGKGVWAYYGCYINVYPTKNTIANAAVQTLFPSTHACLVAQIAFDDAPIPTGQGLGPENFDKLAQRNLVVTLSDNPGPATAHRIPQTFDSRPGKVSGTGGGIADYPDELMIDWGDTPVGSIAHIYWPQVKSADVLSLAKLFYSTHQLSARDEYTVQCTVLHGYTFVPVPPGSGENFAGLFTVDLPAGAVHTGQEFTITVRRLSTREGVVSDPPPPPPPIAGRAKPAAGQVRTLATTSRSPNRHNVDWRYVVGTFAVRIPVTTSKVMLPLEENTYAILKWRYERLAHTNRWRPVLKRYLEYIAARIEGLGGQPWKITPSPWGYPHGHRGHGDHPGQGGHPGHGHGGHLPGHLRPGEREHTGKVDGLVYDRFGDFEGFLLMTEEGHQRSYRSREAEIEALVRFAWQDRAVIAVITRDTDPSVPISVILRRAPPQPKRWPA
ncbi:S53 family peptidase [Burkholderia sp. F1]|uniref:S53 family peptidase n=1 Tax=Burkholderia sp. F1 TaxID=3366817 RepID=UPI003D742301